MMQYLSLKITFIDKIMNELGFSVIYVDTGVGGFS